MLHELDRDPLDFIERDLVAGAIVKLGGARAFMRGHGLRFFQRAAADEIGGDPRRTKCMAPNLYSRTDCRSAALDHGPGISAVHGVFAEASRSGEGGPEQRAFLHFPDARRFDIRIEIGFEIMVCRDGECQGSCRLNCVMIPPIDDAAVLAA